MNRNLMPLVAALLTGALTIPLAAIAADAAGIAQQGVAWAATAIATAATSAIAAVIAKVTRATLDAKARDTIQTALERGALLAIPWLLEQAAGTDWGRQVQAAIAKALAYAEGGAAGSLARFDMQAGAKNYDRLTQQAKAAVIREMGKVLPPDQLSIALTRALPKPG